MFDEGDCKWDNREPTVVIYLSHIPVGGRSCTVIYQLHLCSLSFKAGTLALPLFHVRFHPANDVLV